MTRTARARPRPTIVFRLGTGAFALVLIVIVVGIGVELYRQSRLSIAEFGWRFWATDTWDPVSGEFGARPFIWGTLYSSVLALLISTPIALGIAIYISELAPNWQQRPLVFLTELLAAIPSIVYGLWGIFVLVPLVRQFELNTPGWLKAVPLFIGPSARRRHAVGGADSLHHGHPVHLVGGTRGAEGRSAGAA